MHRRRRWRERDETSCASRRWEGVGNEEDSMWVSCYGVRKGVYRAGQGGTRLCLGCEKEARKERRYVSWGVGEEVDFFFLRCFIMFFFFAAARREGVIAMGWACMSVKR